MRGFILKTPFGKELLSIVNSEFTKIDQLHLTNRNKLAILNNISRLSKFAFDQDFTDFTSKNIPEFSLLQQFDKTLKGSSIFLHQYLNHWKNGTGRKYFLNKYSIIEEIFNAYIDQTFNFINEIRNNFLADNSELLDIFNGKLPIGEIVDFEFKGDTHQSGRVATILTFTSGKKLVYKARSGALDITFNTLLQQLNADLNIKLKGVITLDKKTHCWAEYIEHQPCSSSEGLKFYYERCGALLAVCYILHGTDFHFENVIACGDYPVLVDLECLFSGVSNETDFDLYTAYSTGLVPFVDAHSNNIDHSGLGAFGKQVSNEYVWEWICLNTDALRLEKKPGAFKAKKNQPYLSGKKKSPKHYLSEIISGFRTVCQWFILNKEALDIQGNAFKEFKNKSFRVLLRRTRDYQLILENSFIPISLSNSIARKTSIYDDLQAFPISQFLPNCIKDSVIEKEFSAIESLNIPYFIGNTSSLYLKESDDMVVESFFKTSPYDFVLNKIKRMSNDDIEYQIALIKSSFVRRYNAHSKKKLKVQPAKKEKINYDRDFVLTEALKIADQIKKTAFKHGNQYLWNCYSYEHNGNITYDLLKGQLYNGKLGIAFFLSLVSQSAGKSDYDEIIEHIIDEEIKTCFKSIRQKPNQLIDLTFCTGIAGLIYTLITYSSYNKKIDSLKNAHQLTDLITLEDISKDNNFDIIAGNSGLLLVLILLFKKSPSSKLFTLINSIGNHLLDNRIVDDESGCLTWKSATFDRPLTGLSHGASGIALSLLRLYEITGTEKYSDAFYEAIRFENYYIDEKEKNWIDLRTEHGNFQTCWCHGAPGIGLMRLHAFQVLNNPSLINDIYLAIDTTQNNSTTGIDHYCCGNAGRIDFLIEASAALDRPDLLKIAKNAIDKILEGKIDSGFYKTFEHPDLCLENLSLFRGISGIGYVLLRSIEPKQINCLGLLL